MTMSPETVFRGHDESQCLEKLSQIFQRYSRYEDYLKSPEEHFDAMKDRFCAVFLSSASRPALSQRIASKSWAFSELKTQLKTGQTSPDNVDIGLEDKRIVLKSFMAFRDKMQRQELELKRA